MANVKPFKAIRPSSALAAQVAALPYDVYNREEAAEKVKGHPLSFLNIEKRQRMPFHFLRCFFSIIDIIRQSRHLRGQRR